MTKKIDSIINSILNDYKDNKDINRLDIFEQPEKEAVNEIIKKMLRIIFPGYYRDRSYRFFNLNSQLTVLIEDVMFNLRKQITMAIGQLEANAGKNTIELESEASEICNKFFEMVPKIREYVETDVHAFYEGDPAAYNTNEIILSYPGLFAITVSRIAHELYVLGVPLIPRMMTERAHSLTGIDIHPGATIGKYFFIDHGTGIVIGETTIIGNNVKIYQGVTLGGLSTRGGQNLKGKKRHPTIEDNVTIYSNASVLGGETVIGEGSVIGGNCFVTSSVKPNTRVNIRNQELEIN